MKLGIVSSIWEIAGINFYQAMDKMVEMEFKYIDVLAFGSADPTKVKGLARKELVEKFRDLELISSNMVMLTPGNISSNDLRERERCLDYSKHCAEFQAELGGKQILLGFGGGSLTLNMSRERAWVNSVEFIRGFCEWLLKMGMLLTLELDPFVFCVINDTNSMARIIADVNMDNLFANTDLGHLVITREPPVALEKLRGRILHVHISDNNGKDHANYIIGKGITPLHEYIRKLTRMEIDGTCARCGEVAVATMELGELGNEVKDPDGYVRESLGYMEKNIPELTR